MFITRGGVDSFVVDVFEGADWRFGDVTFRGELVHCFEDENDVRTGVNFRMRCEFALHRGAATLTGGALKPCYGAIALLGGALRFHLRSDSRMRGAVRPCMGADALLTRAVRPRLGSDPRLTGAFALHLGAVTLTRGVLNPRHGATALLGGALRFHLRSDPASKANDL